MKIREEMIAAYARAFREESNSLEDARILYQSIKQIIPLEERFGEECVLRCLSEEIENIICGYMESQEKKRN